MGKLFVDMFMTMDGVIQAPGGRKEDTEDDFEYGGWQAPFFDEESGKVITEGIEDTDALLLGRKTYDIFAGYWPKQAKGDPIADQLNKVPKYVASRKLKKTEWQNSTLIDGDLAKAIPKIKAKHKEVHVIGSANMIQTLLKHDLVDTLNLWMYPLVLGSGKRLFAEGTVPTKFRLTGSQAFPGGAVHLVYERAGKPTYRDIDAPTPQTA